MAINRHGLSRVIPEDIKRKVRQRSHFGCVVCGIPFIQYEHFNPEFKDAEKHDENGITILCGTCHDKKTKRLLSVQAISEANLNPYVKNYGIRGGDLDFGNFHPIIEFGGNIFKNTYNILRLSGETVIAVEPGEQGSRIFLLTIHLKDRNGKDSLIIHRNEIILQFGWDVKWISNQLVIRSDHAKIDLELLLYPPDRLVISRLKMKHLDYDLVIDNQEIKMYSIAGRGYFNSFTMKGNTFDRVGSVIDL